MRRALAITEASLGKDHPNVATELSNLATLLRVTNRLAEAEALYRRALAITEASYGSDHPTVAIRLNNLAGVLRATNRLSEAEPLTGAHSSLLRRASARTILPLRSASTTLPLCCNTPTGSARRNR